MKFEFLLKIKEFKNSQFILKYKGLSEEKNFEIVKKQFEDYIERNKGEWTDFVLLINKLSDDGDFVEVIQ